MIIFFILAIKNLRYSNIIKMIWHFLKSIVFICMHTALEKIKMEKTNFSPIIISYSVTCSNSSFHSYKHEYIFKIFLGDL